MDWTTFSLAAASYIDLSIDMRFLRVKGLGRGATIMCAKVIVEDLAVAIDKLLKFLATPIYHEWPPQKRPLPPHEGNQPA